MNSSGGLGELPALAVGDVTIDASGSQVILDGSASPDVLDYGLLITSDDNTILGLDIQQFDGDGIIIQGGDGNQIGGDGAGEGNIIHLNGGDGIVLDGAGTAASPNVIAGNRIGTDELGNSVEANDGVGIRVINGSDSNVIGGATPTSGNVISGNADGGIVIDGSDNTVIQGNRIGLDAGTGSSPLGNGTLVGDAGVLVSNGSTGTTITQNAIGANTGAGVFVVNSSDTQISDNRIGIDDAFGMAPGLGNGNLGIHVFGSPTTIITDNTVADNVGGGILLESGSDGSTISGNLVGLGADGEATLGNGGDGIRAANSTSDSVSGNVVANNSGDGIEIAGAGSTGNSVSGNQVGLTAGGTAGGNSGEGVLVSGGASGTGINDNTIANNGDDGVDVRAGNGNTISGNSIFANDGLGIDLASNGVTANDFFDPDVGPNALQNFPVLLSAVFDTLSTNTTVTGFLNSEPGQDYSIEFFANSTCDPSLHGEAETPLGTTTVTTDGFGNAGISIDLTGAAVGQYITATATNVVTGNTSELSLCVPVTIAVPPPVADFVANPTVGVDPLSVSFTDRSTGTITDYFWIFGDGRFSRAQNPTHTYTAPGRYTVWLIVIGPGGIDVAFGSIRVIAPTSAPPPAAQPSPTLTNTLTPSVTPTLATPTVTLTSTRTPTVTATASSTSTVTPSRTATATATASRTATMTATASLTATQTATMTATASRTASPTASVTATLPPTSTATATLAVSPTPLPELTVVKATDESGFNITLRNAGAGDINDLQLQESLRAGVRYVSSQPGAPVCIEDQGVVFCALGSLAAGDQTTVDFGVLTDGTDPSSGRTVVTANGATLTIIDQPYLFKVGEPPVAAPGATVTYTLRVVNPTNETASQVRVEDTMPEAIEILSATASSGVVQVDGQHVLFTQPQLGPGSRVTITLTTRVREDASYNEIVNRACLTTSVNTSQSCAQMRFLRAGEIPPTGETPLLRSLLTLAGAVGLLFVLRLLVRRSRQL